MNAQEEQELAELVGKDEAVEFQGAKFRFKRLKERKPGESWILLVYGPSKAGKTFFGGTAGPRTLFINIGEGIDTLLSPAFTTRYPAAKDMIVADVRESETGKALAFDEVTSVIDEALKLFPDKFDTIVIDEATAFRKFALNRGMELNTEARTRGSSRGSRTEDFVTAEVGDYGKEMQLIEWFLATYIPKFKAAKKHFILLAHERQTFGKPAKIGDDPILKRITPGFTGKTFPDAVPVYFDDVFRMEVVGGGTNVAYRIRTAGSEIEMGGVRHGGVFDVVEANPNFLTLLAKIQAGVMRTSTR
ncbi:MAG: AAA family ATPase [Blastocatellia bacterium]|nr:AAA family ATPase [Blastocatellia bacterium]